MQPLAPISLDDVRAAAARLDGVAIRSPLLRLEGDAPTEIHLKLESLQPTGSFKVRGAGNALAQADPALLARGVATASAGNMARAAAWLAQRRGVPCTVVAPDDAPAAKLDPVAALGARIVRVPFDAWWQALVDRGHPELDGFFIHPVSDPAVIAGNGTVGLEIVADLPDVDAVVVPFGGGGLSSGIACAVKALRPRVRVFAAEVASAAPLAPSLAAGQPVAVERTPSFVDGMAALACWPRCGRSRHRSWTARSWSSLRLWRRHCGCSRRATGSWPREPGAAAVAAALTGRAGTGRVVAVISGGNIDTSTLAAILAHRLP